MRLVFRPDYSSNLIAWICRWPLGSFLPIFFFAASLFSYYVRGGRYVLASACRFCADANNKIHIQLGTQGGNKRGREWEGSGKRNRDRSENSNACWCSRNLCQSGISLDKVAVKSHTIKIRSKSYFFRFFSTFFFFTARRIFWISNGWVYDIRCSWKPSKCAGNQPFVCKRIAKDSERKEVKITHECGKENISGRLETIHYI